MCLNAVMKRAALGVSLSTAKKTALPAVKAFVQKKKQLTTIWRKVSLLIMNTKMILAVWTIVSLRLLIVPYPSKRFGGSGISIPYHTSSGKGNSYSFTNWWILRERSRKRTPAQLGKLLIWSVSKPWQLQPAISFMCLMSVVFLSNQTVLVFLSFVVLPPTQF